MQTYNSTFLERFNAITSYGKMFIDCYNFPLCQHIVCQLESKVFTVYHYTLVKTFFCQYRNMEHASVGGWVCYFKSSYHLIPNALWPDFCYSWSDFIQTPKGGGWSGAPEITPHPGVVALIPKSVYRFCVNWAELKHEGGCDWWYQWHERQTGNTSRG